jgi:hypothetical protein
VSVFSPFLCSFSSWSWREFCERDAWRKRADEKNRQLEAHKALMGGGASAPSASFPGDAAPGESTSVYGAPAQAYATPSVPFTPPVPGFSPVPGPGGVGGGGGIGGGGMGQGGVPYGMGGPPLPGFLQPG